MKGTRLEPILGDHDVDSSSGRNSCGSCGSCGRELPVANELLFCFYCWRTVQEVLYTEQHALPYAVVFGAFIAGLAIGVAGLILVLNLTGKCIL